MATTAISIDGIPPRPIKYFTPFVYQGKPVFELNPKGFALRCQQLCDGQTDKAFVRDCTDQEILNYRLQHVNDYEKPREFFVNYYLKAMCDPNTKDKIVPGSADHHDHRIYMVLGKYFHENPNAPTPVCDCEG